MINGIYTAVLLVVFLGIVAWAWSRSNKEKFEELAKWPLQDDDKKSASEVTDE